jgi:hypothetical protein
MKKTMRTILLSGSIVLFITFVSCDKPIEENQYRLPFIELYHCADTNVNGRTIRLCFDSLVSDSRCPLNANCVWMGEATVKLSLQAEGEKRSFNLSTFNHPPAFRSDTTVSGYRIKLRSVTPYPGDHSNTPYRVEVLISK